MFESQVGRKVKNLRKELKATKSVAIVYLAFCMRWFPTCIITTIAHVDKHFFMKLQRENIQLFLAVYYLFVEIVPVVNTMVNPLIYSFSNGEFRREVYTLWMRFLGRTPKRRTSDIDLIIVERTLPRPIGSYVSNTQRNNERWL